VAIHAAYYAAVALLVSAAFFPEYRLWGLSWWAYYPGWVQLGILVLAAAAPLVIRAFPQTHRTDLTTSEQETGKNRSIFIWIGLSVVVSGCLFYALRARTHFLGDGYQLLSLLADQAPAYTKNTEIGEAVIHRWLRAIIGGDPQSAALLSYRIVSIVSGMIFTSIAAVFARILHTNTRDRLLFYLGLCTGGYMLLYFGYVENYSLFTVAVLGFTLTGLAACLGKLSRWWSLFPLAAAIFLHVLGVCLVPSALYLILAPTGLGRRLARARIGTKWLLVLLGLTGAALLFGHYYTSDYVFRFAFVPILSDRFTVEGYTLFSWNHLVDFLNLLILLLPGWPVLAAALLATRHHKGPRQRSNVYLAVLTLSVLGAVFILDPKLGMPRDWDLFSFAGIPLAVAAYHLTTDGPARVWLRSAAALSLVLGLFVLIPRVLDQSLTDHGTERFKSYLSLDVAKSRNGWPQLATYYRSHGDTAAADATIARWKSLNPDVVMLESARRLFYRERKVREATALGHEIVKAAPTSADGYALLGMCYLVQQQYDSALAYLKIADGLRPDNYDVLNNLGYIYQHRRDFAQAEKALRRSVYLNSANTAAVYNLARLYRDMGRGREYAKYLTMAASNEKASPNVLIEAGDYYAATGSFERAAATYRRALGLGGDTSHIRQQIQRYPRLAEHLK